MPIAAQRVGASDTGDDTKILRGGYQVELRGRAHRDVVVERQQWLSRRRRKKGGEG